MAAKLEKTATPGVFRRHAKSCARKGRCDCAYVIVWRHRGRQHMETHRTFAEAREAKGNRDAGDRHPVVRVGFDDYFTGWIESYAGRTARGFGERSRELYRHSIEQHALPRWGTWRLADVEPADVRELFSALRDDGVSTSAVKGVRAALSALFATAVEDRLLRSNPVHGVRIPAASSGESDDQHAKALTRADLALLLAALPADWRLVLRVPDAHRAQDLGGDRADLGARGPRHAAAGTRARAVLRRRAPAVEVAARPAGHSALGGDGRR